MGKEPLEIVEDALSILRACALEKDYGNSVKVNREAIRVSVNELQSLAAAYRSLKIGSHEQAEHLGSGPIPPGQSSETER